MKFIINNEEREVFVEYKKKKNLSLQIDPQGFITIRAPKGISEEDIRKLVDPMVPKIEKKLEEIAAYKKIYEEGTYNNEDQFKLFGKYENYSDFNLDPIDIGGLRKFYTRKLSEEIERLLKIYSDKMRVKYKEYKITETKTTWGTCNTDKKLTFNLRLAMAPKEVIEYVVVHELAHINHMNHDRSFWSNVGKFVPDYKERQKYLKKFGQFMQI